MARITVEDCIDKFPSRFELVLVSSQRARKLHSGDQPTVDSDNDKNTVIALREIAEETISAEEMKESLIEEYQTVTITDEEEQNLELESSDLVNSINAEPSEETVDQNKTANDNNDNEDEEQISPSKQLEKEIQELTIAENSELESQYEISDDLESSENSQLSQDDEQKSDI